MEDEVTQAPFTGFADAPEIFVDGYHGVSLRNGVAKVNFYSYRYDPVSKKHLKMASFVMVASPVTLIQLKDALSRITGDWIKEGILEEVDAKGQKK